MPDICGPAAHPGQKSLRHRGSTCDVEHYPLVPLLRAEPRLEGGFCSGAASGAGPRSGRVVRRVAIGAMRNFRIILATIGLALAIASVYYSQGGGSLGWAHTERDGWGRAWVVYLPELVVCIAFAVAGFVQGVSGFASGMVSMAILPLAMPMIDVVPIVAIFCAATNLTILLQLRQSLDEQVLSSLPMLIFGQFGGVPLGVLLLQHADPEWLRIMLGITMLGFVAHEWHHKLERCLRCDASAAPATGASPEDHEGVPLVATPSDSSQDLPSPSTASLFKPSTASLVNSVEVDSPKKATATSAISVDTSLSGNGASVAGQIASWWGLPFGLLAGVLNGALNEGGPPVVVFFALRRWDKDKVKVALQAFFVSMSATTLMAQAMHGLIQRRHIYFDVVGLPAAAAGIKAGTIVYSRFDTKGFADVVVVSLLVTGILFIHHAAANLQDKHGSISTAVYVAVEHVGNASSAILTRSAGASLDKGDQE
eukprot:COSAG02_NODE_9198_length_2291_cov_6.816318_2_plen_482_part_00